MYLSSKMIIYLNLTINVILIFFLNITWFNIYQFFSKVLYCNKIHLNWTMKLITKGDQVTVVLFSKTYCWINSYDELINNFTSQIIQKISESVPAELKVKKDSRGLDRVLVQAVVMMRYVYVFRK